jgi:hypothetical protein
MRSERENSLPEVALLTLAGKSFVLHNSTPSPTVRVEWRRCKHCSNDALAIKSTGGGAVRTWCYNQEGELSIELTWFL